MLSFAETTPSVIVSVNNIKGTCPNQNCYYSVDDSTAPTIMSASFSDPSLSLTLTQGTATYTQDQLVVSIAGQVCNITSFTTTSVVC